MFLFLIPLILGFASNLASVFTTAFSHHWSEKRGSFVTVMLRDIFGIPIWTLGFVLAYRAQAWFLFKPSLSTQVIGWFIFTAGSFIIVIGLYTIRKRAVIPSTRDTLVQNGIYRFVRHPIHVGTILEFTGLLIVAPTQSVANACILGFVWVLLQAKLEEYDLLQRLPGYVEYMKRVPRFIPRLRKDI